MRIFFLDCFKNKHIILSKELKLPVPTRTMHILTRKTLKNFWLKHPDAEEPLKAWFREVGDAEWNSWTDIKARYPKVSPVGNNRYVFDIKSYRLIVKIQFVSKLVFVRRVVTHPEYDKIKNIDEV